MHPEKPRKGRSRKNSLSSAVAQRFNKYWRPRKQSNRTQSTPISNPEKDNETRQGSSVLELNNNNYSDVIADATKDVVVEFYDQEVIDHHGYQVKQGYRIEIARSSIRYVQTWANVIRTQKISPSPDAMSEMLMYSTSIPFPQSNCTPQTQNSCLWNTSPSTMHAQKDMLDLLKRRASTVVDVVYPNQLNP
jgi:hypothetical protein